MNGQSTASAGMAIRNGFCLSAPGNGASIPAGLNNFDRLQEFARSVSGGLAARPRRIESRFLYDARGSSLFELITEQPEYYLTRVETTILSRHSSRIRQISGGVSLVELGSGNSVKTGHLLKAWLSKGGDVRYIPVDVSETALQEAGAAIGAAYPGVRVTGINNDYTAALPLLREISPCLVLFLGSTIGNFVDGQMSRFLIQLAAAMSLGDLFLVGLDLVKEQRLIEDAYNDAAGVTREFTRNLFVRMNRELGSGIDVSSVEHEARYNPEKAQVEICARFTSRQEIGIRQTGEGFIIGAGEAIETEISRKFRLEEFIPYLKAFGFAAEEVFTDDKGWFALVLLRRIPTRSLSGGRPS